MTNLKAPPFTPYIDTCTSQFYITPIYKIAVKGDKKVNLDFYLLHKAVKWFKVHKIMSCPVICTILSITRDSNLSEINNNLFHIYQILFDN